MSVNGGDIAQLTTTKTVTTTQTNCVNEHPSWFADGSGLVYSSNCNGHFDIYRAELRYTQDKASDLQARLANPVNLTKDAASDRHPRLSTNGLRVAFSSNRDGNFELYVMSLKDGSARERLTTSSGGDDENPTWAPDGAYLVYSSNVEGDYELYTRSLDAPQAPRQLTNNTADDRWPIFAQ